MVTIHADRASSQRAEIHDGSAGLGSNAIELLQPGTNLIGAIDMEKIEGKCPAMLRNLL
jgi:hypothetical protein